MRFGFEQSDLDFDAGLSDPFDAAAVDVRGRVLHGDDDALQSGADDGVGTGGGLSVMGTRFEGDEDRRTVCGFACSRECMNFCMWPSELLVISLAEQLQVVVDDHRADGRIRFDVPQAAGSQLESPLHHGLRGFKSM